MRCLTLCRGGSARQQADDHDKDALLLTNLLPASAHAVASEQTRAKQRESPPDESKQAPSHVCRLGSRFNRYHPFQCLPGADAKEKREQE